METEVVQQSGIEIEAERGPGRPPIITLLGSTRWIIACNNCPLFLNIIMDAGKQNVRFINDEA